MFNKSPVHMNKLVEKQVFVDEIKIQKEDNLNDKKVVFGKQSIISERQLLKNQDGYQNDEQCVDQKYDEKNEEYNEMFKEDKKNDK